LNRSRSLCLGHCRFAVENRFLKIWSRPRCRGEDLLKEKDLLSGIENFSQRRKGCTGDLNADLCLVIKSVSQRARVESNIEHKGIHSPNKRCTTNTVWANQYRSLDCLLLT
jgi:hypothetical protein